MQFGHYRLEWVQTFGHFVLFWVNNDPNFQEFNLVFISIRVWVLNVLGDGGGQPWAMHMMVNEPLVCCLASDRKFRQILLVFAWCRGLPKSSLVDGQATQTALKSTVVLYSD
jgi:hypothetical protein